MTSKNKVLRNIVSIDKEACTGCGDCLQACMEHALELGKDSVRLKGEMFCDGQGICISACPENALRFEEHGDKFKITINTALCNGFACRRCEDICVPGVFNLKNLING